MTQQIDISAEAVKAWLDQHTRLFMHAWYGLAREEQKQTLDMLTALSAERVRLLQEAFDNAQDAYRWHAERDALKVTVARLVEAAKKYRKHSRLNEGVDPWVVKYLNEAIAAARETER